MNPQSASIPPQPPPRRTVGGAVRRSLGAATSLAQKVVRHLWAREIAVGLISGAVVAAGSFAGQLYVDNERSDREMEAATLLAEEADRRENLRFVRQLSDPEDWLQPIGSADPKPIGSVDLTGKDLSYLQLSNAQFDRAVLDGANFWSTNLNWSQLTSTSLVGANFTNAKLIKARLAAAKASGANFSSATLDEAEFIYADLTGANFSGSQLVGASLTESKYIEANFTQANLTNADLTGAILTNADLTKANLSGAKLVGAQLSGVNFDKAELNGTDLAGTDLRGLDLSKAALSSITWEGTMQNGTRLLACHDGSTLWPKGFTPPPSDHATCQNPWVTR
jgi:uncharacterized protein YjbI with pentapeptide repeats